jgi:NADH-quinone oxidoreductase subunit G
VRCTIDGFDVAVPKGTLIIRAAEQIGVQIPRFCDHPLLEPVGACRQCLVEVEGQRKPVASCTMPVTDGMVVKTQLTSPVADKAQQGTMELLLINHPLDCPVCDKGGECPLQNQAMSNGRTESRFVDVKRTYPKPLPISSEVLLDRERCVLCARCTRLLPAGGRRPVHRAVRAGRAGAGGDLRGRAVRVLLLRQHHADLPGRRADQRPVPVPLPPVRPAQRASVCEHCASGCAQRTDYRRGKVLRRLAGEDPAVNEEWNCDKGRWAFRYATANDRLTTPLVRRDGVLQPASWPEAWAAAAEGLRAARDAGGVGVLPGGRLTVEDAYAYAKFARVALGTNDVDARARAHSAEELAFLAAHVAGTGPGATVRSPTTTSPRARGAARRPRAGGGVADRLPAAAPGGADEPAGGVRPRPVRHSRRREAAGHGAGHPPGAEARSLAPSPRAAGAGPRSRRCGSRVRSCSPASGWPSRPARSPPCRARPGHRRPRRLGAAAGR